MAATMLGLITLLGAGAARAEPRVELEAFLGGGGPSPGLMGSGLGGGGRIGVPLGERLVLATGVAGQGSGGASYTSYWVRIPAELKVYLTQPRAGALVPQLVLGAAYVRTGTDIQGCGSTGSGLEGTGGLGLSYLVNERFGVSSSVGLTYGHYEQEGDGLGMVQDGWQLGLDWRIGLLFRI